MIVALRAPEAAATLSERVRAAGTLPPFADEAVSLLAGLSRRLLADAEARRHPALQALGYWLRPAALARLRADFARRAPAGHVAAARGLALHFPPANVPTMPVYSWVPALLAGNANILRLSRRQPPAAACLLRLLEAALAAPEAAAVARMTAFVAYDPAEEDITARLSAGADLRLVWGGDDTVLRVRAVPMPPHGLDLAFPDRFSLAVLDAGAVAAATGDERQRLAEALHRDLFTFDQMACSSPRLLVWVGAADAAAAAGADLLARVGALAAEAPPPDAGAALDRLTALHRLALDIEATALDRFGPLMVLAAPAATAGAARRTAFGGGLLVATRLDSLDALPSLVTRRDQTLVHFGLDPAALRALAPRLPGVERVVPVGRALDFDAVWDGIDLLSACVRFVRIEA